MIEFIDLKFSSIENGYVILKNQFGSFFCNDINKDTAINIEENCSLNCLITNEFNDNEVVINLTSNSHLKVNIFTSNTASNGKLVFNLDGDSSLEVAFADFSIGKEIIEVVVNLNGVNASVDWHLASLAQKDDFKEYRVNFHHNVKETYAKMENYGVCKDNSTLNFLGDAIIYRNAKKSKTRQNAKIVIFDRTCHAKASPKLCIYENDVEASHGASEGQINKDHLFYLMARGLNEDEAKRLIIWGYLYPIANYFNDENIKKNIEECIVKRV